MTVLIICSRFDLTCDYVIAKLHSQNCSYIRVNSEDLPKLKISFEPTKPKISVKNHTLRQIEEGEIRSVYFRRPVFLRDFGASPHSPIENFYRQQWATLIRNLVVLESPLWVNHPAATYLAEHKAFQLYKAKKIGFQIPKTIITNDSNYVSSEFKDKLVVKGLDTVLVRDKNTETFGFTQILDKTTVLSENLNLAPVLLQEPIYPKLDIRVTVVGSEVFAAQITVNGQPIDGDWRLHKKETEFIVHQLPKKVENLCKKLVKELNLVYGAIDLALSDKEYFFLEINPTGEWAWLVDEANLPIDEAIASLLATDSNKIR